MKSERVRLCVRWSEEEGIDLRRLIILLPNKDAEKAARGLGARDSHFGG